jgi:hypothetical protein
MSRDPLAVCWWITHHRTSRLTRRLSSLRLSESPPALLSQFEVPGDLELDLTEPASTSLSLLTSPPVPLIPSPVPLSSDEIASTPPPSSSITVTPFPSILSTDFECLPSDQPGPEPEPVIPSLIPSKLDLPPRLLSTPLAACLRTTRHHPRSFRLAARILCV